MNYNTLDRALDYLNNGIIYEDKIPEIDFNFLLQLEENNLTIDDMIALDEGDNGIAGLKNDLDNIKDLRNQWKRMSDKFVMHKWIIRYIKDDAENKKIHQMFELMSTTENYSEYQKCYKYFCNIAGIPTKGTIIEWITFGKDKTDKTQDVINIKYSKGLHIINIPEGMMLYHSSPAKGIDKLIPSFRSKSKGKYFYPTNRVFFTIQKDINPYKFGLGKGKFINTGSTVSLYKYTPKKTYSEVYMDPTYSLKGEIGLRSVYVETNSPIPVIDITNQKQGLLKGKI